MLRLFVLSLIVFANGAAAQDVPAGSCERGTARAVLETHMVRAPLLNTGQLFDRPWYTVPKETGTFPVEDVDLWVSGIVEDSLRTARAYFFPGDFWPGPLADADAPPVDCSAYDRIWTVSRVDVERYVESGMTTVDLVEWPYDLGAPVIDGDGDPYNYDLEAGDQPDLFGDVAAWWITNDAGNTHGNVNTGTTAPLGMEVRTHAFAFEESPFGGIPDKPLTQSTFYKYEFTNRQSVSIDSIYVSQLAFGRTGNLGNDFLGTDTLRHVAYIYNAENNSIDEYGDEPAAWGIQVLNGPVGLTNGRDDDADGEVDEPDERLRLSSSPASALVLSSPSWYSTSSRAQVNVQKGLFPDGAPIGAFGGGEYCSRGRCRLGPPTVFAFPADPAKGDFWSEMNTDSQGGKGSSYYRQFLVTTGPFRLGPGESAAITYAMPFARTNDHLKSVTALRTIAGGFLSYFSDGFPSRPVDRTQPPPPSRYALTRVRPNPTSRSAEAVLELPEDAVLEAAVYDVLGRRVAIAASGTRPRGRTVISIPEGLAPGAYVLRVEVDRARVGAVPFTVVR